MKRIFSVFLIFILLVAPVQAEDFLHQTADYLLRQVPTPHISMVGGEWTIIGLARSGASVPEGYFEEYLRRVEQTVLQQQGVLHQRKYTEYSRVILALHALGRDARNVAGYSLVAPLEDFEKTVWQGMNGAVWALIALDSHPQVAQQYRELREQYLSYILQHQLLDGGFPLSSDGVQSDTDLTAMALQAMAPYRERVEVQSAVMQGLSYLKGVEWVNVEQPVQTIVALCSLGISCEAEEFGRDGKALPRLLMDYMASDGGFRHTLDHTESNLMATEQALYALSAIERAKNGKSRLYDMGDAVARETAESAKHPDVHKREVLYPERDFADIGESPCRAHILSLAQKGILNGKTETLFDPTGTMTRAEFATITVQALGLPEKTTDRFWDVTGRDWFYGYVGTASSYGIVNGVSDNAFQPSGLITLQEAAVMLARAGKLCGMETEREEPAILNALAGFTDYRTVAEWAREAVAFCCDTGILSDDASELQPERAVTREEIAGMVDRLLIVALL